MPFRGLPDSLFNEFMGFMVRKNEEHFVVGNLNAINVDLNDLKEYFREVCDHAVINGSSLIIKCGLDDYLIEPGDLIAINKMAQDWLRRAYDIYASTSDMYKLAVLSMIERGNLPGAAHMSR